MQKNQYDSPLEETLRVFTNRTHLSNLLRTTKIKPQKNQCDCHLEGTLGVFFLPGQYLIYSLPKYRLHTKHIHFNIYIPES
jgi:hypothetical protein